MIWVLKLKTTEKLTEFIVLDNQPILVIEHIGFANLPSSHYISGIFHTRGVW